MSVRLTDGDSRFRLELFDPVVVLTQSAGQPQFSEQAAELLRHLHRRVLQSVLHLQNVCPSGSVELMEAVNEFGRFETCN